MVSYILNNLDNIFSSFIIVIIVITIYDLIKNNRKLYISINKLKINIQNKDNWSDANTIDETTRNVDLDINLELYNNKQGYNSIRKILVIKKNKRKYLNIENPYLNLINTSKTISGSSTFEKLKYINFLPNETKLVSVKIKLTKDEFINIKKNPIYISYKEDLKTRKINLNKYLRRK